ncbi:MAG: asparagine synthase (glutamine-hydrolyzing) [Calditrichia bacterium]
MCGICGIVERGSDNQTLVKRMVKLLAHRGPDAFSVHQDGDVCLGHRRLSIIDLATGDQPVFTPNRDLCIVYNGEVYNYQELRDELTERGYVFKTASDTEVVLRLYEDQGVDAFARLNGIFAFAILDKRDGKDKLVLARDHFGIKPLHYYAHNGRFLFASEQKCILLHPDVPRELNKQSLHYHVNLRYTQSSATLFKDIYRLPPAHYMIVEDGIIQEKRPFFTLEYKIDHSRTEDDWLEEIPHVLKHAVKRQLMSDVPLGVYLSGGMDSGSIVAMMRECGVEDISTFTMGFNEPTDELDDARETAKFYDTDHHELTMELNPMRLFPEVIWHAEEPKINLLQGFLMSRFVGKHVKVVLGGLGGDELFSGYDIHRFMYLLNSSHKLVPAGMEKNVLSRFSSMAYSLQTQFGSFSTDEYRRGVQMGLAAGNVVKSYLILRNAWDFDRSHWKQIYSPGFLSENIQPIINEFEGLFDKKRGSALEQVYYAEFMSKMVNDYLLTEDRMSMANSVEERVPFLDLDLVQLGFSIPAKMKMRSTQTKYLLRKAMTPYLPERIIRKKKWGFTFNSYLQFQKDLKPTAERILTKKRVERDGIFNYDYIRAILDTPPHPKMRWHYFHLWLLTGLCIWQDMYLNSNKFEEKQFELEAYFE